MFGSPLLHKTVVDVLLLSLLNNCTLLSLSCRLRDRVTVKTGPRHIIRETEDGTCLMTIKSAVRSDSGIYTCKIINEYGTKQCEGKLQVKGRLPFKCGTKDGVAANASHIHLISVDNRSVSYFCPVAHHMQIQYS